MVDNVKETNHDGEKPEEETGKENKYLLPDKAYKALKWVALIALPAVAWLVGAVGPSGDCRTAVRSSQPSTRPACSSAL